MHVLVTADTLGGVWTYTRELVTGLVDHGVQVTLVSFGAMPSAGQTRWMAGVPGLAYYPTAFKLEWMQDSQADLQESSAYLQEIIRQAKPDLLHFSQFYYGSLDCALPRIVVAHSDVVSWWVAVHGHEPPKTSWITWYRDAVGRGLAGADAVIAPSQWMLDEVHRYYLQPARALVIHNGRTPALWERDARKEMKIVSAGRLWDQGKNARILLAASIPARIEIAGANHDPETHGDGLVASKAGAGVALLGVRDEDEMVRILSSAAIYVAPSRYEPFGLTPVEAGLSRCALVLSDIPSFRELWDGAAIFFRNNDAQDLKRALDRMIREPHLSEAYGNLARNHALRRFQAAGMIDGYLEVYKTLSSTVAVTA